MAVFKCRMCDMDNYKKAYCFADDGMKQMLDEYYIKWVYRAACAKSEFESISGYRDADAKAEECAEIGWEEGLEASEEELKAKEEERRKELQKQKYQKIIHKESIAPGELVRACIAVIIMIIWAIFKIMDS